MDDALVSMSSAQGWRQERGKQAGGKQRQGLGIRGWGGLVCQRR